MLKNLKNFAVISLGCKVNRAEVDSYSAKLICQGWKLTDVKNADIVLINTCTVTSVADKKTRQAVRKVCKESNASKIIVTGCASAIDPDVYSQMDDRVLIIPKKELPVADFESLKILAGEDFRSRAALKIQDGCNNACTYCIVHTARGKAWSMNHDDVEAHVKSMFDAGINEVVLSGVDIGAYNDEGFGLEDLCESLLGIIGNKNCRIRISSIEPNNVSDRLIDILANADGKICRHLHMPLQSGSSKVLKEMARCYDAEDFLTIVNKLKNKISQIALSTDIIVGFPGETEDEFSETVEVAKQCGFMKLHVFPYSKRKSTPAADRKDQISEDIKADRSAVLRLLSDELAAQDLILRKGKYEFVLVEAEGKARSESYHLVDVSKDFKVGDLISVQL